MKRVNINPLSFIDNSGTKFFVGDVVRDCYSPEDTVQLVCFGFYDDKEDVYDGWHYGCGFYLKTYNLIENHWVAKELGECNFGVTSIWLEDSFNKETDPVIISQIRECFNNDRSEVE